MTNRILIIAHAPLAHALRTCALHVFPDCGSHVAALDVQPNLSPEESLAAARIILAESRDAGTLVLTDLFGATPCNVAHRLVGEGKRARLVTGVNLPMLLRTVNYCQESLEALVSRAVVGGTQGVMQVAIAAPQTQARKPHDPAENDSHQQ